MINAKMIGMKILHITTHNENCGIGKYQETYVDHMTQVETSEDVTVHDFFPHTPSRNRELSRSEFAKVMQDLESMIDNYDLVHIQHEFAFYLPYQIQQIVSAVKKHGKPLVATIHTAPVLRKTIRPLTSVKGALARLRNVVLNKQYLGAVTPLAAADYVIVHNSFTKKILVEHGFEEQKVLLWFHPVYVAAEGAAQQFKHRTDAINKALDRKNDDIVIATVGYINFTKGGMAAVKTLSLLPDNYKLSVLGGIHPKAQNDLELDLIADEIVARRLRERIYVTGFIEDDVEFDACIKNADIICYLYQPSYASSSGAVNKAISNHKPVVATPVRAFVEMNADEPVMKLADSFSYLDAARAITETVDKLSERSAVSRKYAEKHSFNVYARRLLELYRSLDAK